MSARVVEEVAFAQLQTPCALVETDLLERNLNRVAEAAAAGGVAIRPHVKAHKCLAIARRQLDLGAVGIMAATLDEAEGLVDGGVEDVLVYYPMVGELAIERLLAIAARASVAAAVQSAEEAEALDAAARARGTVLDVLIDVDTGLNRTGVHVGEPLEQLALTVGRLTGLALRGIGTHEGYAYGFPDPGERRRILDERLGEFAAAGTALGVEVVSCGSTPSVDQALGIDGITEVRPGNYVFMDRIQIDLGVAEVDECAFTVLSTVISSRGPERATVDAGSKALSSDRGAHGSDRLRGHGLIPGRSELSLPALSEEHGFVEIEGGREMNVGERVRIIPNHACATVPCFGSLTFVRGAEVLAQEPLAGRRGGRS